MTMIMNRSKKLFNSLHEIKAHLSTKAKDPSHYETLNVPQNSTQDDIKTAYYKMSKKYHPDVNKSEDAKKKFQNLSDAYEVLGNFKKRKLYDRDLIATGRGVRRAQTFTNVEEDPLAGFYKSRTVQQNTTSGGAGNQHFDFDEWTRAHYGKSFSRTLNDNKGKIIRENLRKMNLKSMEKDRQSALYLLITTTTVLMFLLIHSTYTNHYDSNLIDKRKSSSDT